MNTDQAIMSGMSDDFSSSFYSQAAGLPGGPDVEDQTPRIVDLVHGGVWTWGVWTFFLL
jgi:hypothetical protein